MESSSGTYSWTGSGFTTKSPTWSSGTWKEGWWKSSGKKEKKYKSSLGYSSSSYYDYTSSSYYKTWGSSYTNTEDAEAVEKLLTSAYKSVREAVVILDFPFKVDICFSESSFSKKKKNETTRKIFLSTKMLDDDKITDAEKIDILCGSGIHEASHLKYTELRVISNFSDICKKTLTLGMNEVVTLLANIIEDERVEDRLLRERPGYENFITKKKEFDYNRCGVATSETDTISQLFKNIVKFIRFRSNFQAESIPTEYTYIFDKVDKELQDIYGSNVGNTKLSCKIAEDLSKFLTESLEKNHGFDHTTIQKKLHVTSVKISNAYTQIFSGLDSEIELTSKIRSELKKLQTTLVDDYSLTIREKLACGDCVRDANKTLIIKDVEGDIDNYNSIKKKILPLVPALKRILIAQNKNYDFTIHGCRSGILDTTKLAEAYQGVPQVYTRLGHVRTNNTAICVLIDESGSMGYGFHGTYRYKVARECGILFNEAFGGIPGVDLFIYGHTADNIEEGTAELSVYREPGMKIDQYKALSKVSAKYENRDGDAILSAARRIRKYTNSHCTMFVISDGSPCAVDYYGSEAVNDTRKKIIEAQKTQNVDVIGICIDSEVPGSKLYDSYVNLYDLNELPKTLGRLIKKTIMESRSTVTS
jgi:hypothetical protein